MPQIGCDFYDPEAKEIERSLALYIKAKVRRKYRQPARRIRHNTTAPDAASRLRHPSNAKDFS